MAKLSLTLNRDKNIPKISGMASDWINYFPEVLSDKAAEAVLLNSAVAGPGRCVALQTAAATGADALAPVARDPRLRRAACCVRRAADHRTHCPPCGCSCGVCVYMVVPTRCLPHPCRYVVWCVLNNPGSRLYRVTYISEAFPKTTQCVCGSLSLCGRLSLLCDGQYAHLSAHAVVTSNLGRSAVICSVWFDPPPPSQTRGCGLQRGAPKVRVAPQPVVGAVPDHAARGVDPEVLEPDVPAGRRRERQQPRDVGRERRKRGSLRSH